MKNAFESLREYWDDEKNYSKSSKIARFFSKFVCINSVKVNSFSSQIHLDLLQSSSNLTIEGIREELLINDPKPNHISQLPCLRLLEILSK